MEVKKFESFAAYEAWTDTFENAFEYQMIPTIVDDGWKVSIDLFTECKSAKTAIRRFVRIFSESFPDVKDWGEGMLESIESGYWHSDSHGYQDAEEERRIAQTLGAFSWGIEEAMDGEWYIYLNVSGEYAGRGQKAPATDYTAARERQAAELQQYKEILLAVQAAARTYAKRTGSRINQTDTTTADLAADAYIIAQETPQRPQESPSDHIRRAAYEAFRRAVRAQQRHHHQDMPEEDGPGAPAAPDTMADRLAIMEAINSAGPVAVMLADGLTVSDVARHLSVSRSTAWRLAERARDQIRAALL